MHAKATLSFLLAATCVVAPAMSAPVPRLVEFLDALIETSYGPKTGSHNNHLNKITQFIADNYSSSGHGHRGNSNWESAERQRLHEIDTLEESNYGKRDVDVKEPAYANYGLKNDD